MQGFQKRMFWQLNRMAERSSWFGLVGLCSLMLSVVLYWAWLIPKQLELSQLTAQQETPIQAYQARTPQQDLEAYLASLPSIQYRAASVQKLIDIADAKNLQLDEVSYKTQYQLDDPIAHYHMQFNLVATYQDIQAFLSQLLNQLDYVAIESLSFNRETVQDGLIEARIQLVLHFNNRAEGVIHGVE